MGIWARTGEHSLNWGYQYLLLAQVPSGQTLLRVHFQWGLYGTTSARAVTAGTATQLAAFGICTRSSAAGGTPPSPYSAPDDADPPTSRWVYWEQRYPVVMGRSNTRPGLVQWRDSGMGGPLSTKGQVLANVPAGDYLNVYMVWDVEAAWDSTGSAQWWGWASTLYD